MNKKIKKAIKILKQGGIVIFPTDTAFGIGCRIDKEDAVKRLFKIRKRPESKAIPVLIDSIETAREYVEDIPQEVEDLMKKYWPGALTIILRCNRAKVLSLVRGGGETVGIRMPNNKIIQEIISEVGKPILGPSANFSGDKTPYSFEDLDKELIGLVDLVIKGDTNSEKMSSTVIDCSRKPWRIMREGATKISNF
jgi:L-threonylcarbamoyladenylate synthase